MYEITMIRNVVVVVVVTKVGVDEIRAGDCGVPELADTSEPYY